MTQRENLIRLLKGDPHATIPVEFNLCPSLEDRYQEETQSELTYKEYFEMPWVYMPYLVPDDDERRRFHKYHPVIDAATEIDEWGIGHRSTPTSMHMTQMLYPLVEAEEVTDIENYPMPTYSAAKNPNLKEMADAIHASGKASLANLQTTIWETSWYLRGMENLMMDMLSEDPMADCLLDRVTDIALSRALLYAHAGVDILFLGDDIGMQKTIMMSQETYRTWLKPRLTKIIKAVKEVNPNIIIFYHTCGFVTPLIPDLIEAGIDVLNPVQPECMDFAEIYEKFGDKLAFHGTIGTQTTMPLGTAEEVREVVTRNLNIAKNGKLFVAPTHLLEPDVPWENIEAYVAACREFKR